MPIPQQLWSQEYAHYPLFWKSGSRMVLHPLCRQQYGLMINWFCECAYILHPVYFSVTSWVTSLAWQVSTVQTALYPIAKAILPITYYTCVCSMAENWGRFFWATGYCRFVLQNYDRNSLKFTVNKFLSGAGPEDVPRDGPPFHWCNFFHVRFVYSS